VKIINTRNPSVLQRISHEKYVLHGSDRPLEVVEPRKPTLIHREPLWNHHAIYASMTMEIQIFRAVIRDDPGARVTTMGACWSLNVEDECWDVWGSGVRFVTGYIHVLPREPFEKVGIESTCLSREPVRTEWVHRVEPSILTRLEGVRLAPDLAESLQRFLQGDRS
jgi:hypothetical protein